jgi:oligo-1,6-glucosidase
MTSTINAAAQVDDPDSVFAHFQRLITLRHDEPVVAHGTFRMLLPEDERVYAFVREHDGDRLLVVANLSDMPDVVAGLEEAPFDGADLLLGSVPGATPSPTDPLAPWESRVFRLK